MDPHAAFETFMNAMYQKYTLRVKKPGNTPEPWKDFSTDYLIKRLYEEINELKAEVERYKSSKNNIEKLADELIDVSDFCMYLWLKLKLFERKN